MWDGALSVGFEIIHRFFGLQLVFCINFIEQ